MSAITQGESLVVQVLTKALNTVDTLSEYSGRIAAYFIIPLTFIVVFEVVARYVFHAPTKWALPLSQFLFGSHFVLSGAYGMLHRSHVRIDLLLDKLSGSTKVIYSLVLSCFILFFLGVLLVWSADVSWTATLTGRRITESLGIPLWPYMWTLPTACFLMILAEGAVFVRNLAAILQRRVK